MAVLHARRLDHRKRALHPAQHFDARAVHQQTHLRIHPQQAIDVVVGLVGDVAQAVFVAVPAQVVAPVVAAPADRPLLGPYGDVLDLLRVADEGVAGNTVVFRAGGQMDTQIAALEVVVLDGVEQRVVDEQRLAFTAADHAVATGIATLDIGDEVVLEGRVGDVVHQDAVVLVVLGAVADHGQFATLHQRVTGTGAAGDVGDHAVLRGGPVVHAVAQVLEQVALDAVAVGVVDVDAVAGVPDMVVDDPGTAHGEQVDAVAAVLGTQAEVALDTVAFDQQVTVAIGPDAEARPLQVVVANLRAG